MPIIVSRGGLNAQKISESGVANEEYLQGYIADNPDALPLEDIKDEVRLLIVGKEFPTPSGFIDILALDGDGDIYIVETKLYRNPDKRLVLAQVLDYGASMWRAYADTATFVSDAENALNRRGDDGFYATVENFFGIPEEETGSYVDIVRNNIAAGNFRFVVLMDRLDQRLKDLILFMNDRSTFNIYAVEMEFYRHEGLEIVIPKLFGAQAHKSITSGPRKTRKWDEPSFFAELSENAGEEAIRVARELFDWIAPNVDAIQWGEGQTHGSFAPVINHDGYKVRLFYVFTSARFYVWPKHLIDGDTVFRDPALMAELEDRLNRVPNLNLTEQEMQTWSKERPIEILEPPEAMSAFKQAIEWMIERIRNG